MNEGDDVFILDEGKKKVAKATIVSKNPNFKIHGIGIGNGFIAVKITMALDTNAIIPNLVNYEEQVYLKDYIGLNCKVQPFDLEKSD